MIWAVGSLATKGSQVREKFIFSNRVHFSKQLGLLNRISSDVHAPWGMCWVTQLKGRNMSISGSIGDISKVSFE